MTVITNRIRDKNRSLDSLPCSSLPLHYYVVRSSPRAERIRFFASPDRISRDSFYYSSVDIQHTHTHSHGEMVFSFSRASSFFAFLATRLQRGYLCLHDGGRAREAMRLLRFARARGITLLAGFLSHLRRFAFVRGELFVLMRAAAAEGLGVMIERAQATAAASDMFSKLSF